MLKRIISNEYIRATENPVENNEIEESDERINYLLKKLKSIDADLFKNLDNEISGSIRLYSRYYFSNGFESGLNLINEINDIKIK